ncbi:MAG: endopeptidase La [Gammaproteobacteria bacterium]
MSDQDSNSADSGVADETGLTKLVLPVLPLRDMMVLPHSEASLLVGRSASLRTVEIAQEADSQIVILAQQNPSEEQVTPGNLYAYGSEATISEVLKLPDQAAKIQIKAGKLVKATSFETRGGCLYAVLDVVPSLAIEPEDEKRYLSVIKQQFVELMKKTGLKLSRETVGEIEKCLTLEPLLYILMRTLSIPLAEIQENLASDSLIDRAETIMRLLEERIETSSLDRKLRRRIKNQIEKNQREYFLSEQIKAAQKELSHQEGDEDELTELRKQVEAARMPKAAHKKAMGEIKKLEMMSPLSAEASVIRNYLSWMISLPWHKTSKTQKNLSKAASILDQDHYGLDDVKERILEYLAVQMRTDQAQSSILCLVGPPGVGKTSLGKSIAAATNREFIHMALGGMRDEAEIRGHRRTYIGAMPGRIIQRMAKAGTVNPLFLLDELDKIGMDYRGDPAAALLEVLDPEQNQAFSDHFLESEYNLSSVMFVCTANTLNIPPALLDRLEIVEIAGYTEEEKLHIAVSHLLPKQLKRSGLVPDELTLGEDSIKKVIESYTREAGVRQLERRLGRIARRTVLNHLRASTTASEGETGQKDTAKVLQKTQIEPDQVVDYLGVEEFHREGMASVDQVGQVTGLAWTSAGGEILTIEAIAIQGGSGKVIKTGSLGDVMQESVHAALSVVRKHVLNMEVAQGYPDKCDIHLHIPSGATPKDGPSAGVGITVAVMSALTGMTVSKDIAMTGEITLRGEVLRIGALKEKLLAARRHGMKKVLIPADNVAGLSEISEHVKEALEVIPVHSINEVWSHVFTQATPQQIAVLKESQDQQMEKYTLRPDSGSQGRASSLPN